jgi:hypothetical protein
MTARHLCQESEPRIRLTIYAVLYLTVKVLAARLDPDLIYDLFFVCRSGVRDDRGSLEGRLIRG